MAGLKPSPSSNTLALTSDATLEYIEGYEEELSTYVRRLFFKVLDTSVGNGITTKVEKSLSLAQAYTEDETEEKLNALCDFLHNLKLDERVLVASSFSNVMNLQNTAEEVTAAQENRQQRLGTIAKAEYHTTFRAVEELIASDKTPEQIYAALSSQTVDLVFTAHPTQAVRRSLLKFYKSLRQQLEDYKRLKLTKFEKAELEDAILANIQGAWRTDEIRRKAPTPQDEMRSGLSYFQEVIFSGLPQFVRRVDSAMLKIGMPRLPMSHPLFKFSSWMGGDRDGNPFVTAECTRDVVMLARITAVNLYFKVIEDLMFELAMWRCSDELRIKVDKMYNEHQLNDGARVTDDRKRRNYADFWTPIPKSQPYRIILSEVRDRLYNTREMLQRKLQEGSSKHHSSAGLNYMDNEVYSTTDELAAPLLECYESLVAVGDEPIANARLLDLIRQVHSFGLSLTRLDIRQESDRHTELMDQITTFIGAGSYKDWSEEKRLAWLQFELQSKRPLISPELKTTPDSQEVLNTFKAIAEITNDLPGSLGAYVISMSTAASDVLCVALLQRECGVRPDRLLRVAPLFEKLDDLVNAPEIMRTLFSNSWYYSHIKGEQEIMIGYSDSGKDAGRMSAAWALYEAQEKTTEVANEFKVFMTLFHGRGGSVGRGGGPSNLAILSQPPGSVHGSLRVTVQGEVIEQSFGIKELCFRTLDLFTAATLEHSLEPPIIPKQEWRDTMAALSEVSCKEYRSVVFEDPRFVKYFNAATPSTELGRMNIGSRPSKRKVNAGIDALRAIPWIFAWTQTRFHLPVWLGIGTAFSTLTDDANKLATLREMYKSWPFFKVTLDMLEMILAKSERSVAKLYESQLVDPSLHEYGKVLFSRYDLTIKQLLRVTKHDDLLDHHQVSKGHLNSYELLKHKLDQRAPYLLVLNALQVTCLKSLREIENSDGPAKTFEPTTGAADLLRLNDSECDLKSAVEDTLQITMKGIAAGMNNTG